MQNIENIGKQYKNLVKFNQSAFKKTNVQHLPKNKANFSKNGANFPKLPKYKDNL